MIFCRWLLVWVGAAAAGCAHDGAMHAPVADAAAPPPWFCQTDAMGTGWQCGHDGQVDRIVRIQPHQPQPPHAVETRAAPAPAQPAAAPAPKPRGDASGLPPDGFVVQLLAMSSKRAIESLAAELQVPGLSAARIERDGQLFYVLLFGVYPDRDAAESASAARPEALRRFEPWIRRFGSLQDAIQRADALAASLGVAE